jgi:methionyl aminopeptidase
MIELKSPRELEIMYRAGQAVAGMLSYLESIIGPGMATRELDQAAASYLKKINAKSAFLGYHGYPAHVCVSVNEEVVHGIPGDRVIREGDVVSIDAGAIVEGFYGDSAITLIIGKASGEAQRLVKTAERSLYAGIDQVREGNRLSDVSHAIEQAIEKERFGIVRDFVGHGIGRQLHEDPAIPNFGPPGMGPRLRVGMVLAIEPMVTAGSHEVQVLADGWTAVTKDRSLAAHAEHTVAVTKDGPRILTDRNHG